ncbi:hypothetical protein HY388_00840 [Candidatus Daviesbacteria bacterium]|nr:hypothetical protein [Candidatus Daviesbacteria bacterium]
MSELFLDTAKIDDLTSLMQWGIFSGITTNPLIFREVASTEPLAYYQKIAHLFPNVPVSIQLLEGDVETLVKQGKAFAGLAPNVVVKVPMFGDGRGLTVLTALTQEGIKVNVTGLMSAEQLLLALIASPGPSYVSLFFNRIKDGGGNPQKEISNARELIEKIGSAAKIIVGSIRKGDDVREGMVAGGHIVTVTPKVLAVMVNHPKSVEFITQSQSAWDEIMGLRRSRPQTRTLHQRAPRSKK